MQAPSESTINASHFPDNEGNALLAILESARDHLARSLVHEYHTVTDPELNSVTVSSIFQMLFLKAGQERGFVEPGTVTALAEGDGIEKRMARACSDAGLHPDHFFERGQNCSHKSPALPDEPLRKIIRRLDHPDFTMPFFCLSLEDLGVILDRFLGTRLQAAEGCRVKRVGKSALLYTGTVDVPPQNTIEFMMSEAIRGITDRSAMSREPVCRILDMACGSGLFLLAAYRHLVQKKIRAVDRPAQVKDILLDLAGRSVFGIDIDPESVSAARVILLFAFIEESGHSGSGIPSPAQIREACACLTKNIRCGNSLIATDYFIGKPVFPFNAAERRKVNPFDWTEAFPCAVGGEEFDALIGAPPPYRPFAIPAREEYFQTHYDSYAPAAGLYGYFIERGIRLLKPGGKMIVLVPGTFLRSRHARPLRRLLLTCQIDAIIRSGRTRHLPEGEAEEYVLSLRNQPPGHQGIVVAEWSCQNLQPDFSGTIQKFTLDQGTLDDGGWILEDTRTADIIQKIQVRGTLLDHYVMVEIGSGSHHVRENPLVVDQALKNRLTKKSWWCRHFFVPLLRPSDIRRYRPVKPERYVLLARKSRDFKRCQALVTYLEQKRKEQEESGANPGRENAVPASDLFVSREDPFANLPKIIFSEYQRSPVFFFDQNGTLALTRSLLMIPRNDPFLFGILNSTLARFVLTHTCQLTERGYHMSPSAVGKLPVYVPDFDNLADKNRHDRMVGLVTHILELNCYLPQAKTDQERRLVQQEIDATDVRIDALVYELYGLTAEEIAVVESSVPEKLQS